MHFHAYDLIFWLFLLLCSSASRVTGRVHVIGDKGRAEGLFIPVRGVLQPAAEPAAPTRPAAHVSGPVKTRLIAETPPGFQGAQGPQINGKFHQDLAHHQLGQLYGGGGARYNRSSGFQVFSDIDDTLFCTGGPPAGIDRSCYKREIYPGVLQFMLELSRGPNETVHPSKVVPLSEFPNQLSTVLSLEEKSSVVMEAKRIGQYNGLLSWGLDLENAQYGKLRDSILPKRRGFGMDRTKFHRWKDFDTHKLTVFVGDNGQGDQSAAEKMALEADNRLQAAFIHDVRHLGVKLPASRKIHFFETYYDAAKIAFDLGLISQAGKERVMRAFQNASIVKMCNNLYTFTDGRYPCIDKGTRTLFNATTFEPLPTGLTLDIQDGTVLIPECSESKPMITPLIVPRSKWSRCSSINALAEEPSTPISQPPASSTQPAELQTSPASYNFLASTQENHQQAGGGNASFGKYASIRRNLDIEYHGAYSRARQLAQDVWLDSVLAMGVPQEHPWIIFMAGAMGSGKSTTRKWMCERNIFQMSDMVHIDPDEFSAQMPEWAGYVRRDWVSAGTYTRKEAGYLVEIAQEAAMRFGKHIWVDGTLRDGAWFQQFLHRIRAEHPQYKVAIIHVVADEELVLERARCRRIETGRGVAEAEVLDSLHRVPGSVNLLAPAVQFLAIVNTNGESPKLMCYCDTALCYLEEDNWEEVKRRFRSFPRASGSRQKDSLIERVDRLRD